MFLVFQVLPSWTADTWGVVVFVILGMVVGATRFRWLLTPLIVAASALLVVVSLTSISDWIVGAWERADPPPKSADAIVVLSASVLPDTSISSEALDHLVAGLELAHAHVAPLVVTTRVERPFQTRRISTDADQARIVGLFGGGVQWMTVSAGRTTHDEAVNSARVLLPRSVRHIALVVSPMHTRRACATFEAVGFTVSCVSARIRGPGSSLVPDWPRDRLAVVGALLYESTAMLKYRSHGWLRGAATR